MKRAMECLRERFFSLLHPPFAVTYFVSLLITHKIFPAPIALRPPLPGVSYCVPVLKNSCGEAESG